MSELEVRSKNVLTPLILGTRTAPLSESEQIKVSAWGFKTGIMLALAYPKEERHVLPDDYRFFKNHLKPPPGTFTWIARVAPDLGTGQYQAGFSKPRRLHFWKSDGTLDHEGYGLTFSIVSLVFQIVRDPMVGYKRIPPRQLFGRPREAQEVWTRIQPISKGAWPPQHWIAAESLASIAEGNFVPS
jgi:hypothetical protein